MENLSVPQGEFSLARFPLRKNDTLRAWDAADEYLLSQVAGATGDGDAPLALDGSVLVVNDGCGALATALVGAGAGVQSLSDSYLAHLSTEENLRLNGFEPGDVKCVSSLGEPDGPLDVVLLKVPKSLALLEDELCRLRPHITPDTVVVGAGMTKHIHNSTIELFERIIGPTRTSLAVKKARLIVATPDDRSPTPSPWPTTYDGPGGISTVNHSSVFSREQLDIGTRFFLDHLPASFEAERIIDLGCGNGIVGVTAAQRNPDAELTFIDESYMAVASAEASYRATLGGSGTARFVVGDNIFHLSTEPPIERGSIDVVLNNPPFHDDHAIADATAWQMFTESHGALRPGGEMWVVGNRHLAYHAKLKRVFGNCDIVASNSKFIVFRATRT